MLLWLYGSIYLDSGHIHACVVESVDVAYCVAFAHLVCRRFSLQSLAEMAPHLTASEQDVMMQAKGKGKEPMEIYRLVKRKRDQRSVTMVNIRSSAVS